MVLAQTAAQEGDLFPSHVFSGKNSRINFRDKIFTLWLGLLPIAAILLLSDQTQVTDFYSLVVTWPDFGYATAGKRTIDGSGHGLRL